MRTVKVGTLLLLFYEKLAAAGGAGAKKRRRISIICVWNIFFGQINSQSLEVNFSVLTPLRISLQEFGTGAHSRHENRKQIVAHAAGRFDVPSVVLVLTFCASVYAGPNKNVVEPVTSATKTSKKVCCGMRRLRIPQPCIRLAGIPTTANLMDIFGMKSE
jgi:hypothetical protein